MHAEQLKHEDEVIRKYSTSGSFQRVNGDATREQGPPAGWQSLDLEWLAEHEPEPPKFIVKDWLPVGYATLLAGHGGAGKSTIALQVAICIASGTPWCGMPVERRRVLYLSCEDRADVLHWRLRHICAHLGVDLVSLRGWLEIFDRVARDAVLWDPMRGLDAAGMTPECIQLRAEILSRGIEVLLVDGVSDTFGGNENARGEVKRFVNALVSLIPSATGAVLMLGHVAKPTASNGHDSEGYSGSTQWHNAVRARWYLRAAERDDDEGEQPAGRLTLDLKKTNNGRVDQSMRFTWNEAAHTFVGEINRPISNLDRKQRDREEERGIYLALKGCTTAIPPVIVPTATQGQRTTINVLSVRPEFPASLRSARGGSSSKRAAKDRFWAYIETMRQCRAIETTQYRRGNRHSGEQFVLTQEGMRRCAEFE